LVDAYRHERRNYAKHNKETIKTENCEFAKAIVLQQTLKRSPAWTPAVQRGRKVKIKYSLPVRER
jgi:hypothetical protein